MVTKRKQNVHRKALRNRGYDGVVRIVDTRKLTRGDSISGIGVEYGGALVTYHVTDKPDAVLRAIRRKTNLVASYGQKGTTAELGPGLYVSGVPEFWMNRATKKWDFLSRLTGEQTIELTQMLKSEVDEQYARRRITDSERDYAMRTIRSVRDGDASVGSLVSLASQPFVIQFWREEYLLPLGIEPGKKPQVVELEVAGRFAELEASYPTAVVLRTLRRAGLQGAYTRSSMGSNPEMVVWDVSAITSARLVR